MANKITKPETGKLANKKKETKQNNPVTTELKNRDAMIVNFSGFTSIVVLCKNT